WVTSFFIGYLAFRSPKKETRPQLLLFSAMVILATFSGGEAIVFMPLYLFRRFILKTISRFDLYIVFCVFAAAIACALVRNADFGASYTNVWRIVSANFYVLTNFILIRPIFGD